MTIAFIAGTTAEIIKLAPVIRALEERGDGVELWNTAFHVGGLPATLDNAVFVGSDTQYHLRLDSGASIGASEETFVNVTENLFEALRRANPALAPTRHFTASGTGGTIRIPVVPVSAFTLGGRSFPRPSIIVQPRVGYFANEDAKGFIGAYVFAGRRFIVDYPGQRILVLN